MLSIQIIETKIDIIGNYPDQRHFKFEAPIPDENNQTLFKRFFLHNQGCGSGSAWICIHFPRIQEGKI